VKQTSTVTDVEVHKETLWKSIDSTSPPLHVGNGRSASQRLFHIKFFVQAWRCPFPPWKLPQGPMPQYFSVVASLNPMSRSHGVEVLMSLGRPDVHFILFSCKLTLTLKHSPLFKLTSIQKQTSALLVYLYSKQRHLHLHLHCFFHFHRFHICLHTFEPHRKPT
jgi:hypothetical protein